jgi:hypothetical protein
MDPQPESDAKNASPMIPEGKAELTACLSPFEHGRSTLFERAVVSCPACRQPSRRGNGGRGSFWSRSVVLACAGFRTWRLVRARSAMPVGAHGRTQCLANPTGAEFATMKSPTFSMSRRSRFRASARAAEPQEFRATREKDHPKAIGKRSPLRGLRVCYFEVKMILT